MRNFWSDFQTLSERNWTYKDLKPALIEAPNEMSEEAADFLERMVENWLLRDKQAILDHEVAAMNVVTVIAAILERTDRRHLLEVISAFKGYPDLRVAHRAATAMTNLSLSKQQLEEEIKNLFVRSLDRYQKGAN